MLKVPATQEFNCVVACCAHARGSPAHRTSRLAHEGSCALMSTAAWTSVPDMEQADPDPMWTTWRSSSLKELRHPAAPRGGRQSTRQEWWLDSFSVSSLNTFLSFPVFKPMMYQYTPSLDARLFYSLHCYRSTISGEIPPYFDVKYFF